MTKLSARLNATAVCCTIAGTGVHGIEASTNSEVARCQVNDSGQHWILVAYGLCVRGCADCVRIESTGEDNLVVGNQAFNPASGNGFANINLNANIVGPVQTATGYIVATSAYANFSR